MLILMKADVTREKDTFLMKDFTVSILYDRKFARASEKRGIHVYLKFYFVNVPFWLLS